MGGSPARMALLLASCLVSKGVGVDGVRDSLTVQEDVVVKKKVKGRRVVLASLSQTADGTMESSLHKVELGI